MGTFYLASADQLTRAKSLKGKDLTTFHTQALEMRVFNVGAGEAILLSKAGRAVLFDGGAVVKKRNESLWHAFVRTKVHNSV